MNPDLQALMQRIKESSSLSEEDKAGLITHINKVSKELEIVNFKLERTEKVKRTTAILLEETIDELEQKRKVVEDTNAALKESMEELKATQAQLVHAEKMASLGELTAGIAHEIQNPLNFVNNFSEVSVDLINELSDELETGNKEEVAELAKDLEQNLERIHHHGQRASSIVKGMLEHSRTGNNERHPTDINAICDEYIRLAYHGMRAKDNSFKANYTIDLDKSINEIIVVGQDIARVILNLINNSFQAVHEKALSSMDTNYKPDVCISTRHIDNSVEIRVKDNGNGIPEEIRDKIFQPFFTTKPSGEGTGLGLSLSYDIIVKGHGGDLRVETTDGKGSEFIIQLPIETSNDSG